MVISESLRFEITLGLEVLFTIHIKSVGLELEFIHIIIVNYVLKTNNSNHLDFHPLAAYCQ